jgi:hypothetical protein
LVLAGVVACDHYENGNSIYTGPWGEVYTDTEQPQAPNNHGYVEDGNIVWEEEDDDGRDKDREIASIRKEYEEKLRKKDKEIKKIQEVLGRQEAAGEGL